MEVKTIGDGKFMVTRRHDTMMNDHYVFEHVTFDRENREIETYMRSDKKDNVLTNFVEHCKYKEILPDPHDVENQVRTSIAQTQYTAYLFKDPGFRKFLRHKIFSWGVDAMQDNIK